MTVQAPLPVTVTHREVLRLSGPMMVAYMTTPLVGLVDTALVGQLGVAAYIGGVAIATVLFEFILATLNFLRGGTTGLTAQAVGARNQIEERAVFLRAALVAVSLGLVVVLIAELIAQVGLLFLAAGDPAIEAAARTYFEIRVLSSPLTLINFVILGWLLGRGEAGIGLMLQLWLNGVNIAVSIWLVLWMELGLVGAAWGTVLAEAVAAMLGLWLVLRRMRGGAMPDREVVLDPRAFGTMLRLNGDMVIRSFALLIGFAFFTRQSAGYGPVVLAANTVLLRFGMLTSSALDGIAMAAEQLAGKAVGARNRTAFERMVVLTRGWILGLAAGLCVLMMIFGPLVIDLLSRSDEVRALARSYLPMAALLPLAGALAFQMDGIFIGATWSRDMRNLMLISLAGYFLVWALLTPVLGVLALWLSLLFLHGARSVLFSRRLVRRLPKTFGA